MIGYVDDEGRALISIEIRPLKHSPPVAVEVWIDTGFTGELVLPRQMVDLLRLAKTGFVDAVLADGSMVQLDFFTFSIEWFGELTQIEVIANEGAIPLLGVGLLRGLELRVDYLSNTVRLEFPSAF